MNRVQVYREICGIMQAGLGRAHLETEEQATAAMAAEALKDEQEWADFRELLETRLREGNLPAFCFHLLYMAHEDWVSRSGGTDAGYRMILRSLWEEKIREARAGKLADAGWFGNSGDYPEYFLELNLMETLTGKGGRKE